MPVFKGAAKSRGLQAEAAQAPRTPPYPGSSSPTPALDRRPLAPVTSCPHSSHLSLGYHHPARDDKTQMATRATCPGRASAVPCDTSSRRISRLWKFVHLQWVWLGAIAFPQHSQSYGCHLSCCHQQPLPLRDIGCDLQEGHPQSSQPWEQ